MDAYGARQVTKEDAASAASVSFQKPEFFVIFSSYFFDVKFT